MKHIRIRVLIYASLLAIFDQIVKYWAVITVKKAPMYFIGDYIGFEYAENTGIAFSIPLPIWSIIFLNIALFFMIFWIFEKEFNMKKRLAQWGLILIIAGGVGNLVDRFANGFVVDFIALWSYPRFNVADIYISLGVLLMITFYGKIKRV